MRPFTGPIEEDKEEGQITNDLGVGESPLQGEESREPEQVRASEDTTLTWKQLRVSVPPASSSNH